MASYKVIAKVDKGNGIEDYTVYARNVENEEQAEREAKIYFIVHNPQLGVYYGVKSISEV